MTLKQFRKSLNLQQKEIAKEIGVSASFYYKIESGQRNPSFEFLRLLKDKFPCVDIDEMFFKQ